MKPNLDDEDSMRRFLLGSATPEERDLVEEHFMTDGEYFEALCALESEMSLDYIRGRMSLHEQKLFKTAVLDVPARRRQVEEVESFTTAIERATGTPFPAKGAPTAVPPAAGTWGRALMAVVLGPPSLGRLAWAGAAAVFFLAAVVFLRSPSGVPQVSDSGISQRSAAPPVGGTRPQSVVATFVLVPGATRAELRQANLFPRPVDAAEIDLLIAAPGGEVARVGGILRPVGGAPLPLTSEPEVIAVTGGIEVRVRVPARLLPRGDYLLSLTREGTSEPFVTRFFTFDE